ncbi:ABC transporter permease [Solibacillus sp. R5-41]|uniref:ABC transporter permease n=1 Tax=Solibacillus sp. R5-41 TaxID=2048654 RepID=UPI0020A289A4|nr:ABC transporter permease subunit [Solibacillus sp. R5-41]
MILSELKQLVRSKWLYIVLALFLLLFVSIMLLQQLNAGEQMVFDRYNASLVNVLLFLLPLFILTIGAMGVAQDTESGWYRLLRTYPLSIGRYVFSKFIALIVLFLLILGTTETIVLLLGSFLGGISIHPTFLLLALLLVLIVSALSIWIGTFARHRLHALGLSLGIWGFFSLLSNYIVMALGTILPNYVIEKLLYVHLHSNPFEWLRFLFLLMINQTGVLGKSFYSLTQFYTSALGITVAIILTLIWMISPLLLAVWQLKWKEKRS